MVIKKPYDKNKLFSSKLSRHYNDRIIGIKSSIMPALCTWQRFIKAQATLELAILGALVLVGFSVILSYGQRFDSQQQIKMEAFRKALQQAYYKNSAVTFTLKKDTQAVDIFSGYGNGSPSAASASATVMWQKGKPGAMNTDTDTGFTFYKINDKIIGNEYTGLPRYEKRAKGMTGDEQDFFAPISIWNETSKRKTSYALETQKDENFNSITNTKISRFGDALTTQVQARFDMSQSDARCPTPETDGCPACEDVDRNGNGQIDANEWDNSQCYRPPRYVYGGQQYLEPASESTVTIDAYTPIAQGAYVAENGRIAYRERDNNGNLSVNAQGESTTPIEKRRRWVTQH